jgi:hypothetical protein
MIPGGYMQMLQAVLRAGHTLVRQLSHDPDRSFSLSQAGAN